jgi:NAD(P)-dependent dehydrogenase (short-subunit alcohol dehydrogenase family)
MVPTTLITGATRGLGKVIANNLLQKNHKIINISKSGVIPDEFKNKNFTSVKNDITNIKETYNIVNDITEKNKIDNVILNSGITADNFFHKMNIEQWLSVINTNYTSVYGILNPVINQMRENKNGNIIFISSVNAHRPVLGQTNYSSSKNALIGFNRCLAMENSSKNIRCNVISPGYINTEMTEKMSEKIKNNITNEIPLKKFCDPQDICKAVEMLLDKDTYIQGSNIDINGGLFMK